MNELAKITKQTRDKIAEIKDDRTKRPELLRLKRVLETCLAIGRRPDDAAP